MKGITDQISSLELGEQIEIQGTERPNIYAIAKRKGVKVKVNKSDNGYSVTRIGETERQVTSIVFAPEPEYVEPDTSGEWIDIGEHWNEIQGEMVAMQRHYKTGAFREK